MAHYDVAQYDLAIIGSGSGNSLITPFWDDKKVAIIDAGTFGGTCLNVGCIPTKMFAYPAQLAASAAQARELGVNLVHEGSDWAAIRDRIFGRIDAISEGGRHYRADELENVDLYQEHVTITADHRLLTDSGTTIDAAKIVIAAGSRAVLPQVPGIELPGIHTSDTIMRLEALPERLVVVGGGYVASEFAAVFASFGSKVTQVNRSGALLREQDADISAAFTDAAAGRWNVELEAKLVRIEEHDGHLRLHFARAEGELVLDADTVLVAVGRRPNTDTLGVAALGLDLRPNGALCVDGYQRVTRGGEPVEGMFALGDVANVDQLKHVANREARVVVHNLENPGAMRSMDRSAVPAAVFSNPQVAAVGLTEAQAVQAHGANDVATAIQPFGSTAYGWAMEDTEGIVKLVAHRGTRRLLGAHIMGHEAALLVQPLIQAMVTDLDLVEMARGQFWIHPALSEVVENALLSLGLESRPGDPL